LIIESQNKLFQTNTNLSTAALFCNNYDFYVEQYSKVAIEKGLLSLM